MAASPWRGKPFTFRALRDTYGTLYLRCDQCRRYAPLPLTGILEVDYRPITFSCSRCGAQAWMVVVDPSTEAGMADYRLDAVPEATHHPAAIKRLTGGEDTPPPRLGPKHFGKKRPTR